jgi:hypothetical protein
VKFRGGDGWDEQMARMSSAGARVEMHLLLENETLQ